MTGDRPTGLGRLVTVSQRWTCGCTTRPSGPVENNLAVVPGLAQVCDVHGDTTIERVTTRLIRS